MPKHLTIPDGLSIEPKDVIETIAYNAVPGERVRLDPNVRFVSEEPGDRAARRALFGDRDLTVSELLVEVREGTPYIAYRFEGMAGTHNVRAFTDPAGIEQDYGILIHRDGDTWFVPLSDGEEAQATKEPRRIAAVMTRGARYNFGLPDRMLAPYGYEAGQDSDVPRFLASFEETPSSGEYALSPLADGAWRLVASPWGSRPAEREIAAAEEAIAALAPPRPR